MNCKRADKPREYCGIVGVYGISDAAPLIYNGLFSIQHRGQEGGGIVSSDGANIQSVKGNGLISQVIKQDDFEKLQGHIGIGHVRYSTTGSPRACNIQPLIAECVDGIWAVAHNGTLTNAAKLRRDYQEAGAIFQTSTDSEILFHLMADPMYRNRPRRVSRALADLDGAFSFLIMNADTLIAARDRYGYRPLSIGTLDDGYVIASETCALEQIGAKFLRDVDPGEVVIIDNKGLKSSRFADPVEKLGQCIFEHVYFARPDSFLFGQSVQEVRTKLGKRLAKETPVEADVVISVPDSGNLAAMGFSTEAGIPYEMGFMRNHYVGRTFIMPAMEERARSVDMKLAVIRGAVKGKRVVVIDDSIIRGNTCKRRIEALRAAGATEVHFRVSCPPTRHPCFFGIDFPSHDELVAHAKNIDEICELIGADSLGYLSMEGLLSAMNAPEDYCVGCFTGEYPQEIPEPPIKDALESR